MNIATLAVSITANTDKFVKGVNTTLAKMTELTARAATMGAVVASGAALGIFELTKHSMESQDALGKLADRTGIAVEQLSGLQYAAGLSGVSLDSLRIGVEQLLKRLTPGTDPAKAIKDIANQIKAMPDPVARAQLAVEKFGKSGQELLPLLMAGADGIDEMIAANERLGGSLSRIDIRMIEQANDSVSNLKRIAEGAGAALAKEVAPYVTRIATDLERWATGGAGVQKNTSDVVDAVANAASKSLDWISLVKSGWELFKAVGQTAVEGILWSMQKVSQAMGKMIDLALSGAQKVTGFLGFDTKPIQQFRTEIAGSFGGMDSFFENWRKGIDKTAKAAFASTTENFDKFLNESGSEAAQNWLRSSEMIARTQAEAAQRQIDAQKAAAEKAQRVADNIASHTPGGALTDWTASLGDFAKEWAKARDEEEKFADFIDDKLTATAQKWGEELQTPMEKLRKEAEEFAALIVGGKIKNQNLIDRAQAHFSDAASKMLQEQGRALLKLDEPVSEQRAGEIKQFDLSRINVRGLSQAKKQEVRAPELEKGQDKANAHLAQISANIAALGAIGVFQ